MIKAHLSSYSFSDDETREAMIRVYHDTGYIMDPHGAVGYLGLKKYQKTHENTLGIFLETAHPVKFLEVVEPVIKKTIDFPPQIKKVMNKTKKAQFISNYGDLKEFLLGK